MDKGLESYRKSAKELGLSCYYDEKLDSLELTFRKKKYFISTEIGSFNNCGNTAFARNKHAHNTLLRQDGIPVPKGVCIEYYDFHQNELATLIKDLTFPLNVSANLTNIGREFFKNINDFQSLEEHLRKGFKKIFAIYLQEIPQGLRFYQALFLKNELISIVALDTNSAVHDSKKAGKVSLDRVPLKNIKALTKIAKRFDLGLMGINFYSKNIEIPFKKDKWFFEDSEVGPSIKLHEDMHKNNITKLILQQLIKKNWLFYLQTFFIKKKL